MSEKLRVDRDVPPPVDRTKSDALYPWLKMKPGDSFTVADRLAAASARGSFYRYQRVGKIPKSWSVVQRVVEGERTVRLWLVGDE